MFVRSRALKLVPVLALAGLAACAAPSSFDGLTGAPEAPKTELRTRSADPALDAPRLVSPISVSWVSTLRPTFTWKNAPGATGAVLEMCKTRSCDGEDVRRIDVEGETVTAAEDLEPGFLFWRLFSTSKERVGTKPSATWELVLRGKGAYGASDAPSGGIVDVDGDGIADMLVMAEQWDVSFETKKWTAFPTLNVYFGGRDGQYHVRDMELFFPGVAGEDNVAGGVDLDGDGFTDVVRTTKNEETKEYEVNVLYGGIGKEWEFEGEKGVDVFDYDKKSAPYVLVPGLTTLPVLRDAGDVNGDGFGDLIVAAPNVAVVGLGGAKGPATTMPIVLGADGARGTSAIIGAFDADGDRLSDIALASQRSNSPASAVRGDPERIQVTADLPTGVFGDAEKAVTMVSGDFDGDGKADVAATVPIDGRRHVCFWFATGDRMFGGQAHCEPGPPDDPNYGAHLAAGDLSAKGRDELLVSGGEGATSFVEIYGLDGQTTMIDRVQVPGIGGKLTTIWPGRPGKARWATVDANGLSILIFEGRTQIQSITNVARSPKFTRPIHSIR